MDTKVKFDKNIIDQKKKPKKNHIPGTITQAQIKNQ